MNKKEELYNSMKINEIDTSSPINIELIKKMKVEEYIEFQINRQIDLLNKYTEKKIKELTEHKNILRKEIIDKNNQIINEKLNNTDTSILITEDQDQSNIIMDDDDDNNNNDNEEFQDDEDDEELEEQEEEEEDFEEEEFDDEE